MTLLVFKIALWLSSIISIVLCLPFNQNFANGYELVFLLPLIYLVMLPLVVDKLNVRGKASMSLWFFIIFSWLRIVLMPLLSVSSGYYSSYGILGTEDSTRTAIILMVFEHLTTSFFVFLIVNRRKKQILIHQNGALHLSGSNYAYFMFIVLALIVYYIWGRELDLFQFLFLDVSEKKRYGDIVEQSNVIIRAITVTGFTFIVITMIAHMNKQYTKTKSKRYIYFALLIIMLRMSVIVGERRSSQIYLAFTTTLLMIKLFSASKKSILLSIGVSAGVVLIGMTLYKQFTAFLYGSYQEAISNASISWEWLSEQLDAYFFGLKVVASNIGYVDSIYTGKDIFSLLQEIGRNIFGLHYLFRSNTLTAAQQYNLFIYRGTQNTGHLLSSVGYGYLYGGVLLSSVFTLINIRVVFWLEEAINKARSIEYYYILSVIFIRFAFSMHSNPMPLLNYGTQELIVSGVVVYFASIIKLKNPAVKSIDVRL